MDGDSYTYDAIEQRTYDDATGLYYAYDYRGHLWLVDTDSNLATPEQVFHHDCAGNRILEEGWYDDSPSTNVHKTVLVNDIRSGGCGSSSGETKAGEIRYNSSDTQTGYVQYVYGKGMGSLVHELAYNGVDTVHRFRHEDQAGSLIGVTDIDGHRTDEYFYLDFGTPVHRPIAFDGNATRISAVAANTPSSGYTRITLTGVTLAADEFNGKQLRVIGSLHIGEVFDTGTSTIDVTDGSGDIYSLLNAGAGFAVLDFESPAPPINVAETWDSVSYADSETTYVDSEAAFTSTLSVGDTIYLNAGNPASAVAVTGIDSDTTIRVAGDQTGLAGVSDDYAFGAWHYNSGDNISVYTNTAAGFQDFMVGWLFTPNVHKPSYLQVIAVNEGNDTITVKGDARGLGHEDDYWRIHAPVGSGDLGQRDISVVSGPPRQLGSGMHYVPAQLGFLVSSTVEGRQSGIGLSGHYTLWTAHFDPATGTQFQESGRKPAEGGGEDPENDKARIEAPIWDNGYDGGGGGIILMLGPCKPIIRVFDSIVDKYRKGTEEAMSKRIDWIGENQDAKPTHNDGSKIKELGAWKLMHKNIAGQLRGVAYAITVVLEWNCDCTFKLYEQWRNGGDADDNYVSGNPGENAKQMSAVYPVADEKNRCYRALVDTISIASGTGDVYPGSLRTTHTEYLKGRLTVEKLKKQYVAVGHWNVTVGYDTKSKNATGSLDSPASKKYQPDVLPPQGEDVPPSESKDD